MATLCVTNKCSQMKLEVNEEQSEDEEDLSNTSSLQPIQSTLSKLKQKLVLNRGADVKEKMEANNAKLLDYTSLLLNRSKQFEDKSCSEDDGLTFRSQKVLCNLASSEAGSVGKDDSSVSTAPILFGNNSVGKMAVRPTKLGAHQNVPTYTSWIYLDRNQRMTEDQSVQGRRRIYYDPVGNETLIASDSEEEEVEDEDPKHDFSKGEDYIIWTAVLERGASDLLFEQIADSIRVKQEEVEARYELLLNDKDKQAKCEAHAEGIRLKVSSPATRRKGTSDQGQTGTPGDRSRNGRDLKPDEGKPEAKDLVAEMDSFDNLFCRRCLVFDCRLHGCSQPLVHPSEKQPVVNANAESAEPCGAQCYKLVPMSLQRIRDAPSNPCSSEVSKLIVGDQMSFLTDGMDRARVAKKQKTQSGMDDVCSPQKLHVGQSLQKSQKAVTIIDLTEADGESPKKESTLSSHNCIGVKAVDGVIHQLGRLDMSMEAAVVRDRSSRDERTGVTLTKKLARSGKRAFLETTLPSGDNSRGEAQGDPRVSGHRQVEHELPDVRTAQLASKVATVVKETTQEQLLVPVPPSSGGIPVDMDPMGVDLGRGKGKGTSPKKLARSAKMTVVENLSGGAELPSPQIQGDLLTVASEAEQPAENSRNSAARKLARSAKKNFAEKVAGAIQQQQLQTVTDPNNASVGRKDEAREERHGEADFQKRIPAKAGSAFAVEADGLSPHGLLSRSDTLRNRSIELIKEPLDQGITIKEGSLVQCQMTPHDTGMKEVCNGGIEHAKEADPVLNKMHRTGALEALSTELVLVQNQAVLERTKLSSAIEVNHSKVAVASSEAEFLANWSSLEKGLYDTGLQLYGRDSCEIAKTLLRGMKTCAEVQQYISAQEKAALQGAEDGVPQLPDSVDCVLKWNAASARARLMGKKKGSRKMKFSLKTAGPFRKRAVDGKDAPCRQFTPCGCLFTCGKQCPCQLSGTCCEKYCGCAKTCKNRFRGCHCAKSQCSSRQCPCFAAGRECDPDVCRNCWIGCGDGHSEGFRQREDKDNYQCLNMKLLLKQQQRVLLGRSDVAGWGAFLKNTVNKHEYLGEYTGELISHREADKRGKIYDRENSSFLFNLNDQWVLDACRKGNKLKFANHSANPNCYAKVLSVAGDHRVGIFAKEKINAGEELFYDYRYEAERAPVWAKKGEDAGNGKKDDTGPSERRSKHAS